VARLAVSIGDPNGIGPEVTLRAARQSGAALLAIGSAAGLKAQAEAGSAYGARVGCSCRYVEGRDIGNCERDFVPGMALVSLSDDPETRTVTASVPLLGSASARYVGVSGCLMVLEE